jgi:hypothetical protein
MAGPKYEYLGEFGFEKVFKKVSRREQRKRDQQNQSDLKEGPPLWNPGDNFLVIRQPNAQKLNRKLPDVESEIDGRR